MIEAGHRVDDAFWTLLGLGDWFVDIRFGTFFIDDIAGEHKVGTILSLYFLRACVTIVYEVIIFDSFICIVLSKNPFIKIGIKFVFNIFYVNHFFFMVISVSTLHNLTNRSKTILLSLRQWCFEWHEALSRRFFVHLNSAIFYIRLNGVCPLLWMHPRYV